MQSPLKGELFTDYLLLNPRRGNSADLRVRFFYYVVMYTCKQTTMLMATAAVGDNVW